MKFLHALLFSTAFACLAACNTTGDVVVPEPEAPVQTVLSETRNPLTVKVGDTWLFRRLFINEGMRVAMGLPDTLTSYVFAQATSDTTIDGLSFVKIRYLWRERTQEGFDRDTAFSYVHVDDSSIQSIQISSAWMPFADALGRTSGLAIDSQQARLAVLGFYDVTTSMRFPLSKGDTFTFRGPGVEMGEPRMQRYDGQELVRVPGANSMAYRIEHIMPAYLPKNVHLTTWIGATGLVKRVTDFGLNEFTDDEGNVIPGKTVHGWEIIEFLGRADILEDTLTAPK